MFFHKLLLPAFLAACPLSGFSAGQTLTLDEALARTLRQSPDLAAYRWELRAADARTLQARLRPNPELNLMIENFTGSGPYRSGEEAERKLEISQPVELGGKRQARIAEARAGRGVAFLEYESARLDALKTTTQAFIDVLAARELAAIAEENLLLAEKAKQTADRHAETGKVSAVEATRAGIACSTARIELAQGRRALASARGTLAARWGAMRPDFAAVSGKLELSSGDGPLPPLETLYSRVARNPRLAKWATERARRAALVAQAKAQATPDLTFTFGPRLLGGREDVAAMVGISLPLPLWNRNQGNIKEAQANLGKTGEEERAAQAGAAAALNEAWQTAARAREEAETLRREVLPAAREAETLVTTGYEAGRLSQLDIFEARRTLTAARGQAIRALADYHKALAEIEALTAAPEMPKPPPLFRDKPRKYRKP